MPVLARGLPDLKGRARSMWRIGLLLLAVLAAAGPPARAGSDADEAQFRFERGNQHYRNGRFDDALSEYYVSNRLVPNRNVEFNIARARKAEAVRRGLPGLVVPRHRGATRGGADHGARVD